MNKKLSTFLISNLILFSLNSVKAETAAQPLNIKAETNVANMEMVIKDNFIKAKYASAENRFLQSNVMMIMYFFCMV